MGHPQATKCWKSYGDAWKGTRIARLPWSKKRLSGWLSQPASGKDISSPRTQPHQFQPASTTLQSRTNRNHTSIKILSVFHGIAVPPRNNTDDVPVDFPGTDWWKCINTNVASYPRPSTLPQRPSAPKRKLWGKIPTDCHLEDEHRRDGGD